MTPSMVRDIVNQYTDTDDTGTDRLTPITLRSFFLERFPGDPDVREYVLNGTDIERSLNEIHDEYCRSIYSLIKRSNV